MELIKQELDSWEQKYGRKEDSLFHDANFLRSISKAYSKNLRVYTVLDNGIALLSLPVYFNKRDATLHTHFFYQAIIVHAEFREAKFLLIWELIIQNLKEDFDAIDFKLAPYAVDIRPFTWAGFGHRVYYTSSIDLNNENQYSENVKRSIKKGIKADVQVKALPYSDLLLEQHIQSMLKTGLGNAEASKIKSWMKDLAEQGKTQFFELLAQNGSTLGSAIYLWDKEQAYLISIEGGEESSGGQAPLYDAAIEYFRSAGLKKIDLLGGNIPTIAIYKSKLGSKAEAYTIVSYRKYYFIYAIQKSAKDLLKKLLKSIRIINK